MLRVLGPSFAGWTAHRWIIAEPWPYTVPAAADLYSADGYGPTLVGRDRHAGHPVDRPAVDTAVMCSRAVEATMRPTRTWWMKRHDRINYVTLAVILAFIVWTAFFPT